MKSPSDLLCRIPPFALSMSSPFLTMTGRNNRMKSKKTIATQKGESIMATSSFAKDFIVTDKQAPLWEKALAHFENKNLMDSCA